MGLSQRELLVRVLLSQEGVHEHGYDNRGLQVDAYERADDLPGIGYAWCVSFVQWGAQRCGIRLPSKTASVGFLEAAYRQAGWLLDTSNDTPARGDQAFLRIDSRDNWPDHQLTLTAKARNVGPWWYLRTIEGNTSPGTGGSQADGGGVYQRQRVIHSSKVTFGRIPGMATDAQVAKAHTVPGAHVPAPTPTWTRKQKMMWREWRLGEGRFDGLGPANPQHRPKVPAKAVASMWKNLRAFVARRKRGHTR